MKLGMTTFTIFRPFPRFTMDRIAIYLWLVKIMFSFTGVRHYAQHSDVEAVS